METFGPVWLINDLVYVCALERSHARDSQFSGHPDLHGGGAISLSAIGNGSGTMKSNRWLSVSVFHFDFFGEHLLNRMKHRLGIHRREIRVYVYIPRSSAMLPWRDNFGVLLTTCS